MVTSLLKNRLTILMLVFVAVSMVYPCQVRGQRKKRKAQIETVLLTAKGYIGTPYRWGGNTTEGIDCSGLIFNAYQAAGITIPRVAKEQAKYGRSIGWKQVRAGDVVTFRFKEKREKWWHSGLVTEVTGNRIRFVHASSSRGVIESDLTNNYYKKNVKRIRRIIK